ncbi:DNA-processing protein DprA [Halomicrococcus gelatinilyticus]|uniref:DNA-processing protein DprA n=1 Tax=Halomicrococcus gelatinilyticus TaxID=1702103 RepID=UPI002E10BCD1
METDVVLAALNDKHKFNSHQVVELFEKADNKRPLGEIELEVFKDFVKGESLKNDDNSKAGDVLETLENSDLDFYREYLSELKNKGLGYVSIFGEEYPSRLRNIEKPPLILYYNGDLSSWKEGIAVVGTRDVYEHRVDFVEEIGGKLVNMGKTVVSGLANGVDEAAHKSTLEAEGKTIAVLPGHIEKVYPKSNKEIGEQIPENGALVSEVSKKVRINRGRFVERNRITSGLTTAVIIGASGETGGTIHQAKFAQSQNLPILLYDPEEDDGQSPEKLKEMGAKTFSNLNELEELVNSLHETNHAGKNYSLQEYS